MRALRDGDVKVERCNIRDRNLGLIYVNANFCDRSCMTEIRHDVKRRRNWPVADGRDDFDGIGKQSGRSDQPDYQYCNYVVETH